MNKDNIKIGTPMYSYKDIACSNGVDQFDEPLPGYNMQLFMSTYYVTKITPKGVWVSDMFMHKPKFILLSAKKRYAYFTKENALKSLKERKQIQIEILYSNIDKAERALQLVNQELGLW